MTQRLNIETLAFVVLFAAIGYCWVGLAPVASSISSYLLNPAYFALIAATLTAPVYFAVSILLADSMAWRRLLLALFLAGMPLIYLWAAILSSDQRAITTEALGLVIFIPVALFGYRKSLLVLGLGIAAHGVAWDAWHHNHAAYIEPWYPIGCLVVDIAFFIVTAAQESWRPSKQDELSRTTSHRLADQH